MPAYQFTAIDASGKQQKGCLRETQRARFANNYAIKHGHQLVLTLLNKKINIRVRGYSKKFSAYDLALMTRQLSVLVAAAIPLEEALRAVSRQSENKCTKSFIICSFSSLRRAFTRTRYATIWTFPDLYIATVAAGERSGHLDLILDQLSDYTENRFAMQKKVQGAMIYPIILMLMSFGIVMGLMTYVVPEIVKLLIKIKMLYRGLQSL